MSIKDEIRETIEFCDTFTQKVDSLCSQKSEESLQRLKSLYVSYPVESVLLSTIVLSDELIPLRAKNNKKYKECLIEARRLLSQVMKRVETELESID